METNGSETGPLAQKFALTLRRRRRVSGKMRPLRILVVPEFGPGSAGGSWVILKQLLRGVDWSQVYWWSFFREVSSYQFGGRHHCFNLSTRFAPHRRLAGLKSSVLENVMVPFAASDLLSFIQSVEPDFILFLAHQWAIPVVHRIMPRVKTHWHLALHDMPDTAARVTALGADRAGRFMRQTEELYRQASSHAVISPAMAEEMRARTGIECSNIFRCAVEPEILPRLRQPALKPKDDTIRIGYAGTIIAEATFALLVRALKATRERLGRKIEIHLYSWHSYAGREWFDPSLIIEHGSKTEAEIYEQYQQLTWGLAIMNLEETDSRYNRFSFPCKFTAALAAGLPLICLGHRKSALIELAKNYRLGLVLTDEDADQLSDRICERLADYARFDHYRSEIARCAETDFNAECNRKTFQEMLRLTSSI
jgi:glycosyltransferase involved in cell wall biosynthesis